MSKPLIQLKGIERRYQSGEQEVTVLHPLDLTIEAGEMIAIVGASGSGKSTLMNLLGCLDRPSAGQYLFRGQDTATLDALSLARLRCHHFGFIFQRYHLLPHLNAAANVEIPAVYAGTSRPDRQARSNALLARLGLSDRSHHTPGQLSGGQQQRVSIARALANGGEVILADEPTGALDSQSGKEVMAILKELHAQGHTIILVTHDMAVASHADRIITLRDGRVLEDSGKPATTTARLPAASPAARASGNDWDRYREAGRMALHAMLAHRMRTFLTMLGIIIGIAAVVSVVALGQGARAKVVDQINAMGTNTIDIFPGKDWGDEKAASIQTLNKRDLDALLGQPYLEGASPQIASSGQLRYRNKTSSGSIVGVGSDFFRVKGMKLTSGRLFDERDIQNRAAVAVVDGKTIESLLGKEDPVGQVVLVGTLPVRIIGVVEEETGFGRSSQSVNVWLPYSAVMSRLISQNHFSQLTIRVKDGVQPALAEQAAIELLTQRHGVKDFFTFSSDSIIKSVEKTTATMTLLVSAIAVISLIVGGVGVMNIMLVSVVERTREIGIRIAVGARQSDILQQFLIEAVMVSLLGGMLGVGVSLFIGLLFSLFVESIQMQFSLFSILMAFGCSSLIGILFGYLPARNAARLDPVEALARE
ncbi:MacB family efflux pump subunit [Aeromonas salmonicida]|uniref:Pyoverdine export ATP-binding/permease protein PvdT n=1 Tax=Aeromonas salmonicida subsp. pectinolytica 34mel TaxID=1324960 RepID=T0QY00_AERSA|nr:MacB family efflux pump subunit [Aeromonas salmonicida]ATP08704.1 ABC-type transport system ATP-binding/permease protein (probable substrate macrolide) [Aeromonas salmonicida subsp. pectinolytica 34mel]EQC06409.1 ABC-type transporter ATP-binding protein [Aeromonas salmonicida subsp. pectinolytica 34mel]TNI23065.1 MacB family efflux pump subunit [Aeromonas salmonicida]HEH9414121.1 MacB family efflux pump subunit [Aeromonas salmonicida]HEH9423065.1 MacB family efflux pump subunit [Aeromonas s